MRKSLTPALGSCDSLNTARVFGVPLEELLQVGQPGQEVPILVKRIVEYIEEHGGLDLDGLFLVNGNAERVEWLRQRCESGEEVDLEKEADVASAVSLLRLFLQELPEPLIPASLQTNILQLYQEYSTEEELTRNMKYFLQQLPQFNYSLLRFLCRFLSNVASLQEEVWTAGGLAAVFGPDIFHIATDVEDLKEQELVSRVMADLLENKEEFFDSEEEDFSTNDYSSITEHLTELLDDEKLEPCEELPQDSSEDLLQRDNACLSEAEQHSTEVTASSSSHISPLSILPASADIIERTIRAAVEQHLFDLHSSLDHEVHSYTIQDSSSQDEERTLYRENNTAENPISPEKKNEDNYMEVNVLAQDLLSNHIFCSSVCPVVTVEEYDKGTWLTRCYQSKIKKEDSAIELSSTALVDAENNLNKARQEECIVPEDNRNSEIITFKFITKECDINANSKTVDLLCQSLGTSHLDLRSVFEEVTQEAPCSITFPLIDFKSMHLQKDGEDPVPAFKSWQEDTESGEAQLSPLAGRIVHHPLEDDSHPLLARRFLEFGHSQRFLQDQDTNFPVKSPPLGRPRRASFSSKEEGRGDAVPVQVSKKVQSLKKKIKQFEEQFEKDHNYKPSHSDKAANPKVLKWMTELTKLRKQIKDTKQKLSNGELVPQARPRSNTLPKSFGSTLDQKDLEVLTEGDEKSQKPTREATVELILCRLKDKREEAKWPEDIKKMTKEHLSYEKTTLQKNLLYYESIHGRPVTRDERLIVKPLYDRYRLVKQMLTRVSITPIIGSPSTKRRGHILQPIIEGETAHFCDEIKEEEEEEEELSESPSIMVMLDPAIYSGSLKVQLESKKIDRSLEQRSGKLPLDLHLSNTSGTSMPDLLEQLWKAKADKKKLRKIIREFEDNFYQQNGRNVQKEDRIPMMEEYKEYKRIKAKLRLLEVLISKQDSSKSI
ncbi:protein FAM13B isoform X2 [Polypterus senegalus]|uniref:protein FAM13B isoform X2 n=1 Tax=Polypterus senegalus TaxID=55291 RepID=UPI001963DEC0|nr:protein FAM13B isoform X2 [Polypterus senegalus]